MPTVKDKTTGEVISRQRYNEKGMQRASNIASSNPNWEIDYSPGGSYNAMDRVQTIYMGGGKVHKPIYKKGGKVKK